MLTLFVNVFLKIFMIFTPFFVMSAFLSLTKEESQTERQRIAIKITLAVGLTCFALFLFGTYIFALFGITLDAFRIGAGAVLFLSAVSMIQGKQLFPLKILRKMQPSCLWRYRSLSAPGQLVHYWSWGQDLKQFPKKLRPVQPFCAPFSWSVACCPPQDVLRDSLVSRA